MTAFRVFSPSPCQEGAKEKKEPSTPPPLPNSPLLALLTRPLLTLNEILLALHMHREGVCPLPWPYLLSLSSLLPH